MNAKLNRPIAVFGSFRARAAALVVVIGLCSPEAEAMSLTDTSGWNAWTTPAGVAMTDPLADQQTGQGQDDFVGGFKQQAGYLGTDTVKSIMWQTQMAKYDSKGFSGSVELGLDLTGNGSLNLIMKVSDKTGDITFATPGTGANNSPSTTSWGNFNSTGVIALTASNYNYAAVPSGTTSYGASTNAYVTFAISYTNLQAAIRAYAGTAFSSFVVNDFTALSFVAFTSTQGNAINQDLFGTNGNTSSSSTFASLGAGTSLIRPGGGPIPEPAAFYQLGGFIGVGALGYFLRRRRGPFHFVSRAS
jgi:hypothetical protein